MTCEYCGAEIRPLDKHRAELELRNDTDGVPKAHLLVTCILIRSVIITAKEIR